MSSDKSKYSIYLLDKKRPSYSGSSKSPISFAKMFIKNCNLKNKSITFYVKNCKNKKLYGPYLGNLDKKTVKLQKNKQKGGMRIDFNDNFLNPKTRLFNGKYLCFEIKTDDMCATSVVSDIQLSAGILCKKNLLGNGFTISTDVWSFDKLQTDTLKEAKEYLYHYYKLIKFDPEIITMPALNTSNALDNQLKLNELEKKQGGIYPLDNELKLLYQNKALRTAYDELYKMYVGRHLSSVSQVITPSSFALLPNNLNANYKISFSTLGRNPHIFFSNMKNKIEIANPIKYSGIGNYSGFHSIEVNHYFGYLLYKGLSGHVKFAKLIVSGEYPNFRYEIDGYYDLIDAKNYMHVPTEENLIIIRDAILEYRRVYNKPTFATTILNFVISKLPQIPS
jgi:hypothetical protein